MLKRLKTVLFTWPDQKGWAQCAVISALALLFIGMFAGFGGLIHWQPDWHNWSLRLVAVMCVPAFTEELVFRGLLIPGKGQTLRPALWIITGVALFMLWHVVEALTFLPGAHLFQTPVFLLCAGILGLTCALMRYRTGSLWPAVILHGLVVFVWQIMLGGPDIARLLH